MVLDPSPPPLILIISKDTHSHINMHADIYSFFIDKYLPSYLHTHTHTQTHTHTLTSTNIHTHTHAHAHAHTHTHTHTHARHNPNNKCSREFSSGFRAYGSGFRFTH